jgi:hypothetical protein
VGAKKADEAVEATCDSRFRHWPWLRAGQGRVPSPESLIRNVYAHYGNGAAELSKGLPRDPETARQFFDPSLRKAWTAPRDQPYDFLVQSPNWKLGPVGIAILRKQFDKTYVAVSFDNHGRRSP